MSDGDQSRELESNLRTKVRKIGIPLVKVRHVTFIVCLSSYESVPLAKIFASFSSQMGSSIRECTVCASHLEGWDWTDCTIPIFS